MTVSKVSTVTFAVSFGGNVVSQATLELGHGTHTLTWRPPHAGAWTITLNAVDLNDNHARAATARSFKTNAGSARASLSRRMISSIEKGRPEL